MSDDRLSRLCHQLFTIEYPGAIQKIADMCSDTYEWVYQNINGRAKSGPHVKILRAGYLVTGDARLKRELEPEGYELIPQRTADAQKCLESEATDVVLQASNLIEQIRTALKDGIVSKDEADDLERQFCQIDKELIEARATMRSFVNKKSQLNTQ